MRNIQAVRFGSRASLARRWTGQKCIERTSNITCECYVGRRTFKLLELDLGAHKFKEKGGHTVVAGVFLLRKLDRSNSIRRIWRNDKILGVRLMLIHRKVGVEYTVSSHPHDRLTSDAAALTLLIFQGPDVTLKLG